MLIAIENKLEDLFQQIEMMPRSKFEAAVKVNIIMRIVRETHAQLHQCVVLTFPGQREGEEVEAKRRKNEFAEAASGRKNEESHGKSSF